MRINDVRLANIEHLISTKFKSNKAAFSRSVDISPTAIAKWWSKNDHRNVSEKSCAKIESQLSLEDGWLDTPRINDSAGTYVANNVLHRIPVKGTGQLGDDGYWDNIEQNDADGYINIPTDDPDAYSLQLRGDSMRPAIKSGWYAVCEPNHEPVLGEFVHVVAKDGRSMVKELLIFNQKQIVLDSVNEDHKRITFSPSEIDKIHYAFIVPPSKHGL